MTAPGAKGPVRNASATPLGEMRRLTHLLPAGQRIMGMIEQREGNWTERPLGEWSGTYGGFYLLPGDAWGISVAADGSPHARCGSCTWEYDVDTEEEAVRMVTAHLRVAHPDVTGVVDPPDRSETKGPAPAVPQVGLEPTTRRF